MEDQCALYAELTTECGAMCFIPTSVEEYVAIKDSIAIDSVFIRSERPCRVYFEEGGEDGWYVLLYFGGKDPVPEIKAIIAEKSLEFVGSVAVSEDYPYLRIVDAREAHYFPKSPTQAQLEYAAKKAQCSPEIFEALVTGKLNEGWHLSERLTSVPEVYRIAFWTGLDPAPLLAACETEGLTGWQHVDDRWKLPAVSTLEEAIKLYRTFTATKNRLQFRCGSDIMTSHFIYDICHAKAGASPHQGSEYPTNQGTAVAVAASNYSYEVLQLDYADARGALAYLIRKKAYEDCY